MVNDPRPSPFWLQKNKAGQVDEARTFLLQLEKLHATSKVTWLSYNMFVQMGDESVLLGKCRLAGMV